MLPLQARPAVAGIVAAILRHVPQVAFATEDKEIGMKIAVVSDDEWTISQHFGRAPYYVVLTVENGKIVDKETRPKAGHYVFAADEPPELAPGERHSYDAGSEAKHAAMAEAIRDCQVLLTRGMGWGAYESMQSYGIEPVITDVKGIYDAVFLYFKGKLPNLIEHLH
jgi:predicted Fe-Mo cluster-binding NifX family protein